MDFDTLKSKFSQIWVADFEFYSDAGNPPSPICLSANELKSGQSLKLWRDDFGNQCPFDTGKDSLFVAYYSSAEFSCFDVLGWRMPYNVLDLFIEFRMLTNGNRKQSRGLLGALSYFGKDSIGATQKESYQDRILQGPPYSTEEKRAILDYCHSDVKSLCDLLPPMCETIESPPPSTISR